MWKNHDHFVAMRRIEIGDALNSNRTIGAKMVDVCIEICSINGVIYVLYSVKMINKVCSTLWTHSIS